MAINEWLRVGVVTATHGLRGEVKVFPVTEDPGRFEPLRAVKCVGKAGEQMLEIANVRYFKQYVLLSFRGMDRIEDVEGLVKAELYVDRAHALPLSENENYVCDLIGLRVVTDEGEELGTLDDVMETGANDVYVVNGGGREILLPAIRECILKVDLEAGEMLVHLLPGLL